MGGASDAEVREALRSGPAAACEPIVARYLSTITDLKSLYRVAPLSCPEVSSVKSRSSTVTFLH